MLIKSFSYDVRGFTADLAARIDADYLAWHTAEAPASVNGIATTISDDVLVVTVGYTAS